MLTIDKFMDGLDIPYTPRPPSKTVQLILDYKKLNTAQAKRLSPTFIISEKLDGVYAFIPCVRTIDGQWHVRHFGRSGKELAGCEGLNKRIKDNLTYYWGEDAGYSFVLISEVTAQVPLAKLSGYLTPTRKSYKDAPDWLKDNFHDMLSLAEFCEGFSDRPALMRSTSMREILNMLKLDYDSVTWDIGSYEAARGMFAYLTEELGGEGVILKDPRGTWEAGKRDERQLKMKEQLDFDCQVVGLCSGKKGSKYEHSTGKLLVCFREFGKADGEVILLPVGSGLSDEEREEFYTQPSKILGCIIKIKAKSYTEYGNLREPVIDELRQDKDVADFYCRQGEWKVYNKGQCEWKHFELLEF